MVDTTKLGDMIDQLIDKNEEQAEIDFRSYIDVKSKEYIKGIRNQEVDNTEKNEE